MIVQIFVEGLTSQIGLEFSMRVLDTVAYLRAGLLIILEIALIVSIAKKDPNLAEENPKKS